VTERLASQVVYRGRIFDVREDRVRFDGSRVVTMEIVQHRGSVVLLPMPSDREIILVRQYRYAIDRWLWELPAGSLEPDEQPEDGARRECREEVGMDAGAVSPLGTFYPTPGFCTEFMAFYKLTGLTPVTAPVEQDEDEQLEPRTLSLDTARAMIAAGDIVDMKTIVGLSLI
jgi:ADP-ribose pyrophosphatase